MSTMKIPGIGDVDSRWVWGGFAAAGGFAALVWYRRGRPATVEVVTDPATGSNTGSDSYANPDPHYSSSGNAQLPPTTDQEWTQRVMEIMTWLEPSYLANVLGKYLGRQPLTTEEAEVVRQAWAQLGKPPSGVGIQLATGGSTPGTPDPTPKNMSLNLRVVNDAGRSGSNPYVRVGWDRIDDATAYRVTGSNDSAAYTLGPETLLADWYSIPAGKSGFVRVEAVVKSGTGPSQTVNVTQR